MVVNEESHNIPVVVPDAKMSNKESKKFLIVKNHVREIPIQYEANSTLSKNEENAEKSVSNNSRKKKEMKRWSSENQNNTTDHMEHCDGHEDTQISESDLEELRTVYTKCIAVVKKIETKYGYLLNLDLPSGSKPKRKSDQESECRCETNKKIVFDEDGKQITVDIPSEKHICPKKPKQMHNYQNIEIEYMEDDSQLPDSLQDLNKLLQNPNIHNTLRNKVIYKIKCIKEEISNEIKFNKYSLIEKLKNNPDEILGFEGTNLANIPGYQ